jgi:hypothetical protein
LFFGLRDPTVTAALSTLPGAQSVVGANIDAGEKSGMVANDSRCSSLASSFRQWLCFFGLGFAFLLCTSVWR